MKVCDICGAKTGLFNTFRCQDGAICKKCYKIVSGNYASTITKLTLSELKKLYIKNAQPLEMGDDGFHTTRKIASFLLLDDDNRKFCILNNQKLTGQNTRPEILPYELLEDIQMYTDPELTHQQLSALAAEKDNSAVIRKLALRLLLKDGENREIVVIPTPVRGSSFAYRQGLKVAEAILDTLHDI